MLIEMELSRESLNVVANNPASAMHCPTPMAFEMAGRPIKCEIRHCRCTFEQLNELIEKLQQANLGRVDEDAARSFRLSINLRESGISILGSVALATRRLGQGIYLPRASSFSSSALWE